jgi:DNA-binding CsgD family transcriptional regulator/PAS domain-containing protein
MASVTIDPSRLSELIGLIYDAAIDTRRWPIALEAMRHELRCQTSGLALQRLPAGDLIVDVFTNIPQHFIDIMPDYIPDVMDQWGGIETLRSLPLDEPHALSRINPATIDFAVTTNRYSLEWAKPQGLVDVMTAGLARDEGAMGTISFGRHVDVGLISDREMEIMRLLIPHLQRAATINRMLDMAALSKANFEAAIDTLSVPVILTDSQLQIVFANPAARQMIRGGGLIHDESGTLRVATEPATRALEIAVEGASRNIGELGRQGLGIPIRCKGGPNGALHVLPLRQGTAQSPQAMVAIFVVHTDAPYIAPTKMVAALFDLTPAEARVFSQIIEGRTIAEAARELGVEQSTVKTHLLRVYEKTGVRRRSELQQMASSLTAPLAV